MAILMSCPRCQKSYRFNDVKRGKQVRCRDCSHVFAVEKPSANAPAESKAAVQKATCAPRPPDAPKAVAVDDYPTPARLRPTKVVWIVALAAAVLLLACGGIGAVALAVLLRDNKPADNPIAAATTAETAPDRPGEGRTPKAGNPDLAKPPGKREPPRPETKDYWESFNKVDRGMNLNDVVALLGPPTTVRDVDPATYPGVDTRLIFDPAPNLKFTVEMFEGKVVRKINSGNRPNRYPSGDTAQAPPPDKKPPRERKPPTRPSANITQEVFDKIDKGMSQNDVIALVGKPTIIIKVDPANYPGQDTRLIYDDVIRNVAFSVDLFQDKVTKKDNSQKWSVVYPSDKPK